MRIRRLFMACLLIVGSLSHPSHLFAQPDGSRRLVLVASSRYDISHLTTAEIRKLFLGITVEQKGHVLVPLRNQTDAVLHEVFLQKAMFMSAPMYERTLLTRLLRTKGSRPQVYQSEKDLLQALQTTSYSVTYMWASQTESFQDVHIIAEIWHE